VYAGAIMVLFLFVIMLLNLGHDYQSDLRGTAWIAMGSAAFGGLAWLLSDIVTSPSMMIEPGPGMLPAAAMAEHGIIGAIAIPLFRDYVVAFEITSLLLLAAIIGAILLAKRRI
jgi:NADH-quinone oxidoreductase subunit J